MSSPVFVMVVSGLPGGPKGQKHGVYGREQHGCWVGEATEENALSSPMVSGM